MVEEAEVAATLVLAWTDEVALVARVVVWVVEVCAALVTAVKVPWVEAVACNWVEVLLAAVLRAACPVEERLLAKPLAEEVVVNSQSTDARRRRRRRKRRTVLGIGGILFHSRARYKRQSLHSCTIRPRLAQSSWVAESWSM